jgi:hypothetical protein
MCDATADNTAAFRAVVHRRKRLRKIMSAPLSRLCRHHGVEPKLIE